MVVPTLRDKLLSNTHQYYEALVAFGLEIPENFITEVDQQFPDPYDINSVLKDVINCSVHGQTSILYKFNPDQISDAIDCFFKFTDKDMGLVGDMSFGDNTILFVWSDEFVEQLRLQSSSNIEHTITDINKVTNVTISEDGVVSASVCFG